MAKTKYHEIKMKIKIIRKLTKNQYEVIAKIPKTPFSIAMAKAKNTKRREV